MWALIAAGVMRCVMPPCQTPSNTGTDYAFRSDGARIEFVIIVILVVLVLMAWASLRDG